MEVKKKDKAIERPSILISLLEIMKVGYVECVEYFISLRNQFENLRMLMLE